MMKNEMKRDMHLKKNQLENRKQELEEKDTQVKLLREKINQAEKKIAASQIVGAGDALNQNGANID